MKGPSSISQINTIKILNLRKVFRSIQKHQSTTRRQIQEDTGLSWGAVSQFCTALLSSGIAVEGAVQNHGIGKSPIEITLNSDDHYLIGIDISYKYVRGILMTLGGQEIFSRTLSIRNPAHILEYLRQIMDELLKDHGSQKHFLAVGVSVTGATDLEHGILKASIFSDKWTNLNVRKFLEENFQIPVYVYSDTACVLTAEKYFGFLMDQAYQSALLVSLDYGVGMAYMHNRKIFYSKGRHQCELGHITVRPGGTKCNCGKRGCLEMYASPLGLATQFREHFPRSASNSVFHDECDTMLFSEIRQQVRKQDPFCNSLFQQCGELLGSACASACTLLEPDVLILSGSLLDDRDYWISPFEEQFYANIFPLCQTKLVYSSIGSSAPMMGAAFTALDVLLNNLLTDALMSSP